MTEEKHKAIREEIEERDTHDIYKVESWNDCPFRLSNVNSCTYPRGVGNGIEDLVDCIPPDIEKRTVPHDCPLVIGDVMVSLLQ